MWPERNRHRGAQTRQTNGESCVIKKSKKKKGEPQGNDVIDRSKARKMNFQRLFRKRAKKKKTDGVKEDRANQQKNHLEAE